MTKSEHKVVDITGAAIVCMHIAEGKPVLRASRDEPVDEADTGWQFLCGAEGHDDDDAKVWSMGHILREEPTLREFVGLPAGTTLIRKSVRGGWERAS